PFSSRRTPSQFTTPCRTSTQPWIQPTTTLSRRQLINEVQNCATPSMGRSFLHISINTLSDTRGRAENLSLCLVGSELRDALYGPIIPAHLDKHIKRYTRASGEFELVFGREPKAGDILRYEHLALMHSSENYARQLGRMIEAWQRQLPHLACPLKFEDGRLFRRLAPQSRGAKPKWEEDIRIQPDVRWLKIPE